MVLYSLRILKGVICTVLVPLYTHTQTHYRDLAVLILGAILFTDITGIWPYSILVPFSTRLITLLKQPSFSMQQWIMLH